MGRPKLELASWVAGIVSAVLAAIALLLPGHQDHTASKPQPESSGPRSRPTGAAPWAAPQSASPHETTPDLVVSPCVATESVSEGLRVAKTISSSIARNNALSELVDSSLCNNDIELAY